MSYCYCSGTIKNSLVHCLTRHAAIFSKQKRPQQRPQMTLSGVSRTAALDVAETAKRHFVDMNALSVFPVTTFSQCLASAYSWNSTHSASFFPMPMKHFLRIVVYDDRAVFLNLKPSRGLMEGRGAAHVKRYVVCSPIECIWRNEPRTCCAI